MQKEVNNIVTLMEEGVNEKGNLPVDVATEIVTLFRSIPDDKKIEAYITIYTELKKREVPVDARFNQELG